MCRPWRFVGVFVYTLDTKTRLKHSGSTYSDVAIIPHSVLETSQTKSLAQPRWGGES